MTPRIKILALRFADDHDLWTRDGVKIRALFDVQIGDIILHDVRIVQSPDSPGLILISPFVRDGIVVELSTPLQQEVVRALNAVWVERVMEGVE